MLQELLEKRGRSADWLEKPWNIEKPVSWCGLMCVAERVEAAVRDGKRILIYGDYDCDGVMGVAVMFYTIVGMGGNVDWHLPHRLDDGYGLSVLAVEKAKGLGYDVILTVDCGVGSVEAVERACELGVEVLITDHHPIGVSIPRAVMAHTSEYGEDLCGAGVAFCLSWVLGCRDLRRNLFLAAIATVADVVPLEGANRTIVHHGLLQVEHCPVGLRRLLKKLGLGKKITSEDVAYKIGPHINAAGRMCDAPLALDLVINDPEGAVEKIIQYNIERKGLVLSILESIIPGELPIVAHSEEWHPGVIGIAAGRLAEKHRCPVVLIGAGGIGSARSGDGTDLAKAIDECRPWIVSGGGHAAAAGVRVKDIEGFATSFREAVRRQDVAKREVEAELVVKASALTMEAMEGIERMEPFGMGNPRPLLCVKDPKVRNAREFKGHLACDVDGVRAVGFGMGALAGGLKCVEEVLFRPVVSDWSGKVEMHIVDIKEVCSERI